MRIFLQKKFTPISANLKSLNTIFFIFDNSPFRLVTRLRTGNSRSPLKSKNGIHRRARTRPESGSEPARRSIISLPIEEGVFFLYI